MCTLNFLGIMWEMCTVTMFVFVDLQTISYMICMNVYNLHTKFHISESRNLLVTTVKLKPKWRVYSIIVLLYTHTYTYLNKCCIYLKIYYHTWFKDPILSTASVISELQLCSSAIFMSLRHRQHTDLMNLLVFLRWGSSLKVLFIIRI